MRGALVVGGGVSGLSCALRLLEAGFDVELWERDAIEDTVSSVAAAIWFPFQVGANGLRWSLETREALVEMARAGTPGVTVRRGVELLAHDGPEPEWIAAMPAHRRLARHELPAGYARGNELEVPIVEMPLYLAWLRERALALGLRVRRKAIESLVEPLAHAPLVVNCTGLGAREVCGDRELVPVRGQVVSVERRDVERFLIDDDHPSGLCYVVPRAHDCVLGGTTERGVESQEIDDEAAAGIVARCTQRVPALRGARVLGVKAGLRPWRATVRCEAEVPRPGTLVLHDYGHGGAGVSASLGCAAEIVRMARTAGSDRREPA